MTTAVVAVLGGLLTLAGFALLVLPGPGFVLVAAGLAVLTVRFPWAGKPLDRAEDKAQQGVEEVARSPWRAAGAVLAALVLVALGVLPLAGVDLPFVDAFTAACSSCPACSWSGRSSSRVARRISSRPRPTARRGERGTAGAYRAAPHSN